MQNFLLTLAYDGTNYCGFQVQPNGRSVAQTFQDALQAVLGRRGGRMAVQLGGVILGAVIYYIVYQVIIFAGFDTDLLKMFSAVVVAVFLGAPHVKAQLKAHSRSKKGDSGHAENE